MIGVSRHHWLWSVHCGRKDNDYMALEQSLGVSEMTFGRCVALDEGFALRVHLLHSYSILNISRRDLVDQTSIRDIPPQNDCKPFKYHLPFQFVECNSV